MGTQADVQKLASTKRGRGARAARPGDPITLGPVNSKQSGHEDRCNGEHVRFHGLAPPHTHSLHSTCRKLLRHSTLQPLSLPQSSNWGRLICSLDRGLISLGACRLFWRGAVSSRLLVLASERLGWCQTPPPPYPSGCAWYLNKRKTAPAETEKREQGWWCECEWLEKQNWPHCTEPLGPSSRQSSGDDVFFLAAKQEVRNEGDEEAGKWKTTLRN